MNLNFECIWHLHLWFADVAAEKTQKSLFDGIEKFDATRLKHTETQEKNPLPDKDGMICLIKHQIFCTSTYMHADAQRLFNLLIDYTFICQNNIFRNFIALNLTILSMPSLAYQCFRDHLRYDTLFIPSTTSVQPISM